MSVSLLCVCDALAPSVSFISDILKVLCIYVQVCVVRFLSFWHLAFLAQCASCLYYSRKFVSILSSNIFSYHIYVSRIALIQMLVL